MTRRDALVLAGAAGAGLALTAAVHVVGFGPLGAGWAFGTASAFAMALLGLVLNARAMRVASPNAAGIAALGGVARLIALVVAWRVAVRLGTPELESALSMVGMHVAMMVAEVTQAARTANAQRI